MPGYRLTEVIARPVAEVFDFVATRQVENHPKWEPEVRSVRKVTAGPLRTGSRAVMTLVDFGRPRDVPYEVVAFDPERNITLRSVEDTLTFEIAFQFAAHGPTSTDLTVTVRLEPHGLFALFGPLLGAMFRRNGIRLTRRLKHVVETSV